MKKEKKDEMGFHISFSKFDPRQRKTARILNSVGRKKAIIIANALWDYDEDELISMVNGMVHESKTKHCKPSKHQSEKSQIKATDKREQPTSQKDNHTNLPKDTNKNNKLMSSIVATMGQFQDS